MKSLLVQTKLTRCRPGEFRLVSLFSPVRAQKSQKIEQWCLCVPSRSSAQLAKLKSRSRLVHDKEDRKFATTRLRVKTGGGPWRSAQRWPCGILIPSESNPLSARTPQIFKSCCEKENSLEIRGLEEKKAQARMLSTLVP